MKKPLLASVAGLLAIGAGQTPRKKTARGRGNQGDWISPRATRHEVSDEHRLHNEEIDRKKAAKKAMKASRK